MKKSTTIYDISKALNLSPSTISRALNNHPRISVKTKELVFEKAKELKYHQNHLAASLRTGSTNTIGVIVPFMRHNFFSKVVSSLEEVLAQHQLNILITQSHEELKREIDNLDIFIKAQVMGIILSVSTQTENLQHLDKVIDNKIPLILFDRVTHDKHVNRIMINDFEGAFKATEHLIFNGYKRIAHFSVSASVKIYQERLKGYRAALEEYSLPFFTNYLKYAPSNIEAGKAAMKELLQLDNPPDAIFSSSDYSALGALKVLKIKGVKVPKDFGLVGFSNEPFTEYISPSMSSVDQNPMLMGQKIANTLIELIQQDQQAQILQLSMILEPKLIIRTSSNRKAL